MSILELVISQKYEIPSRTPQGYIERLQNGQTKRDCRLAAANLVCTEALLRVVHRVLSTALVAAIVAQQKSCRR